MPGPSWRVLLGEPLVLFSILFYSMGYDQACVVGASVFFTSLCLFLSQGGAGGQWVENSQRELNRCEKKSACKRM